MNRTEKLGYGFVVWVCCTYAFAITTKIVEPGMIEFVSAMFTIATFVGIPILVISWIFDEL